MSMMARLVTSCLFLLAIANASKTFAYREDFIPSLPTDFSKVDIYLDTVGRGAGIYMLGGHSVIRVRDHLARTNVVYNWGIFDFSDPTFLYNFLKGNIRYRMDGYSISMHLRQYQYEQRSVTEDKVELTNAQKEQLMKLIILNAQPENRTFLYHYQLKNCATYPRDLLDAVLNGNVRKEFFSRAGTETLRDSLRFQMGPMPLASMAVEIVMNNEADRTMTAWEEMYRPVKLRDYLLELPAYDDSGNAVPSSKLLTGETVVLNYAEPEGSRLSGFQIVFIAVCIPILILGFLLFSGMNHHLMLRILGFFVFVWGAFSAFFGILMLMIWCWSMHFQGYHNANLWLFWPFDVVMMWVGCRLMWRGQAIRYPLGKISCTKLLMYAHLAITPLFLILWVSGLITQDVHRILSYLAPITILLSGMILAFGMKTEQPGVAK
jgi:hypothetical protein